MCQLFPVPREGGSPSGCSPSTTWTTGPVHRVAHRLVSASHTAAPRARWGRGARVLDRVVTERWVDAELSAMSFSVLTSTVPSDGWARHINHIISPGRQVLRSWCGWWSTVAYWAVAVEDLRCRLVRRGSERVTAVSWRVVRGWRRRAPAPCEPCRSGGPHVRPR